MIPKKQFLITIDTEGDNLWAGPHKITTQNALFLPRFQALCDRYNFKPVYLTDYEMARDGFYGGFAGDVIRRNAGEVGMHLHAWNTPPIKPLTNDDYACMPFLIEYDEAVIREKVSLMTDLLGETFGTKPVSHRAGRWSMNTLYANILMEYGYQVDCSVTPHISWATTMGDPAQNGGTDFTFHPDMAYFVNEKDVKRPGKSSLLEVPMTILPEIRGSRLNAVRHVPLMGRFVNRMKLRKYTPPRWLRPNGSNLAQMMEIVNICRADDRDYIMFMLHSSEFMPGGSPTFDTEDKIEVLYDHLEVLFEEISQHYRGATLKEYYQLKSGLVPA